MKKKLYLCYTKDEYLFINPLSPQAAEGRKKGAAQRL